MRTGYTQGFHRVTHRVIHMFRLFTRIFRAKKAPSVTALEARMEALEQDVSKLRAEWKEVQGRLYAVLGRRGIQLKAETEQEAAQPASLSDPRLTKAQVKAALGLTTPGGVAAFLRSRKH